MITIAWKLSILSIFPSISNFMVDNAYDLMNIYLFLRIYIYSSDLNKRISRQISYSYKK